MKVAIEIQDEVVRRWLRQLEHEVSNLQPALSEIGDALVSSAKLRFRAATSPDGTAWAPLSPVTLALRRRGRGAGGAQPLRDTGRLMNSITRRADSRTVEVGTNVVYAQMQHFGAAQGAFGRTRRGAPIPWGRVPGRPYLGVSSDDRRDIVAILRRRIGEAAS